MILWGKKKMIKYKLYFFIFGNKYFMNCLCGDENFGIVFGIFICG